MDESSFSYEALCSQRKKEANIIRSALDDSIPIKRIVGVENDQNVATGKIDRDRNEAAARVDQGEDQGNDIRQVEEKGYRKDQNEETIEGNVGFTEIPTYLSEAELRIREALLEDEEQSSDSDGDITLDNIDIGGQRSIGDISYSELELSEVDVGNSQEPFLLLQPVEPAEEFISHCEFLDIPVQMDENSDSSSPIRQSKGLKRQRSGAGKVRNIAQGIRISKKRGRCKRSRDNLSESLEFTEEQEVKLEPKDEDFGSFLESGAKCAAPSAPNKNWEGTDFSIKKEENTSSYISELPVPASKKRRSSKSGKNARRITLKSETSSDIESTNIYRKLKTAEKGETRAERRRRRKRELTEEQRARAREKERNWEKMRYASMTEEEKEKLREKKKNRLQKKLSQMTPEEREKRKERIRLRKSNYAKNLDEERKARRREQNRIRAAQKRAHLSEEEKAKAREHGRMMMRAKREAMAEEEKAKRREQQRIRMSQKRASLPENLKNEIKQMNSARSRRKRHSMNEEEKTEYKKRECLRQAMRKKNMSPEQLQKFREQDRARREARRLRKWAEKAIAGQEKFSSLNDVEQKMSHFYGTPSDDPIIHDLSQDSA